MTCDSDISDGVQCDTEIPVDVVSVQSVLVARRLTPLLKLDLTLFRSLFSSHQDLLSLSFFSKVVLYWLIVFTTSVIFIAANHPVFSASSSSLFCPFLGDKRPNIRPSTTQNTSSTSHHGHRDVHFVHKPLVQVRTYGARQSIPCAWCDFLQLVQFWYSFRLWQLISPSILVRF